MDQLKGSCVRSLLFLKEMIFRYCSSGVDSDFGLPFLLLSSTFPFSLRTNCRYAKFSSFYGWKIHRSILSDWKWSGTHTGLTMSKKAASAPQKTSESLQICCLRLLWKFTRNSDLLDKKYKEMRWKFNPFFLFIIPIFTFPHNFFFVFLNIIYPLNANEGVVIQSV